MAMTYASVGTTDSGKTTGLNLTITTSAFIPKGSTVVARYLYDNSGTGTTTITPAAGTVTCSTAGAVTNLSLRGQRGTGAASGAGVNVAVWTFTAGVNIPQGATITASHLTTSVVARSLAVAYFGGATPATTPAPVVAASAANTATSPQQISITPASATQAIWALIGGEDNQAHTWTHNATSSAVGWTMGTSEGTSGGNAATNVVQISGRLIPAGSTTAKVLGFTGAMAGSDWVGFAMAFDDTSPAVSSIAPTTASNSVSRNIVLTGTNFTNVEKIELGGTSLATYTVDSPTQITVTVPAGFTPAAHNLVVFANGAYSDGDIYTVTAGPQTPTISMHARSSTWITVLTTSSITPDTVEVQRDGVTFYTGASTAVTNTSLTQGTTYTYRSRVTVGAETTAWSPEVQITTKVPGSMMTDFAGTTVGQMPPGWQGVTSAQHTRIISSPVYSSGRALLITPTNRATLRKVAAWTAAGSHLNVEVLARFRIEALSSSSTILVAGPAARVEVSAVQGAENSLHGELTKTSSVRVLRVGRYNAGTWGSFISTNRWFDAGVWYLTRFKVETTTSTQFQGSVKLWQEGQSEPATWDVETGNRTEIALREGAVGFASAESMGVEVDAISVGWDGIAAPALTPLPVPPEYHPATPTGLSAVQSGANVNLTWDVSVGATGYKVYRNDNLIGTTAVNSFTDVASPVGSHVYSVQAMVES